MDRTKVSLKWSIRFNFLSLLGLKLDEIMVMVISVRDCRSPQPIIRWFPTDLFEIVLVFSRYDYETNNLLSSN